MERLELEREMSMDTPLWNFLLKDDRYVIEEYEGGRRVIMKIVKKYRDEQFEV